MINKEQIKKILYKLLSLKTAEIQQIQEICHKNNIKTPEIAIENSSTYNEIYLKIIHEALQKHVKTEYQITYIKSTGDLLLDVLLLISFVCIMNQNSFNDLSLDENEILTKYFLDFVFVEDSKESGDNFSEKIDQLEMKVRKLEEENQYLKDYLTRVCKEDFECEKKQNDEVVVNDKDLKDIKNRFEIEHKIIKKAWYRLAKEILQKNK